MSEVIDDQNTGTQSIDSVASPSAQESRDAWEAVSRTLNPLASLRLTVWLFAASIFIIFAGTLAQVNMDVWEVVDTYFRFRPGALVSDTFPYFHLSELFVHIDFALFFPPAFTSTPPDFGGWGFWFPKGWTIGAVLLANLTAAHLVRFKFQAKGTRFLSGLAVTAFGLLLTYGVIATTGGSMGFQGEAAIDYRYVWGGLLFALLLIGVGGIYGAILLPREKNAERFAIGGLSAGMLGLAIWLGVQPNQGQIDDSSMRILWHLIKATIAGLVLLAGCIVLFRKRAGIVLLHGGVMLLMVGEIIVGLCAVEGRMQLSEGESANYVIDIRSPELAITKVDRDGTRSEMIVSKEIIENAESEDAKPIDVGPFDVTVERYEPNAVVKAVRRDGEGEFAFGAAAELEALDTSTGVGESASMVDIPGAVVRLQADGFDRSYVLSTRIEPSRVEYEGDTIEVDLRFKRTYKPYTITLKDVSNEKYIGSDQDKDFSSVIAFIDPSKNLSRASHRIWMNNPLRYGGDTFYQSGYQGAAGGRSEITTLQVVSNVGWSIPYVACMLVAVGMAAQFVLSLLRYVDRRRAGRLPEQKAERVARQVAESNPADRTAKGSKLPIGIALTIALLAVGRYASPKPIVDRLDRDITAFGQLPAVQDGRVKPFSSVALNAMLQLSDKQSGTIPVLTEDDPDEYDLEKVGAVEWLMDLATRRPAESEVLSSSVSEALAERLGLEAGKLYSYDSIELALKSLDEAEVNTLFTKPFDEFTDVEFELRQLLQPAEAADSVRVFRIENPQIVQMLSLPRRKKSTYSYRELQRGMPELTRESRTIDGVKTADMTLEQKKINEIVRKVSLYRSLKLAFQSETLPAVFRDDEVVGDPERRERADAVIREMVLPSSRDERAFAQLPRVVPNEIPKEIASSEGGETKLAKEYLEWLNYPNATLVNDYLTFANRTPMDATLALNKVLRTGRAADSETLNAALSDYVTALKRAKPRDLNVNKLAFEDHYNRFAPFWTAGWMLYLPAFLLVIVSWLARTENEVAEANADDVDSDGPMKANSSGGLLSGLTARNLQAAALTFIVVGFAVHTYALGARMFISGRPPVTNLYSASVFIGWAAALFGMGLELIYRRGLGTLIASTGGFTTLLIGHALAQGGDTFTVMQAVLDTQFWLATHVVIITLGYSATLVAGLLGIVYILRGVLTSSLTPAEGKKLSRMVYGVNCFAILFSFVGTVLGGLWADDSWGRFWGWDPKENGALMIVLWNAIVLHAHWGKMIGQRGLAVLSVLGNIIVSWSWFGVNELNVGMHSYGFTEGVLFALGCFIVSQLCVAAMGLLPTRFWASSSA